MLIDNHQYHARVFAGRAREENRMHPTFATELAALRQAELLHTAENHRTARLALAARPGRRPALGPPLATLARSATATTQRLRRHAGQLTALGAPRQSAPEPCC
jgi:hypothetical protein